MPAKKAPAKRAPRSAKQIHAERVITKALDKAEESAEELEITDVSAWKVQSGKTAKKLQLPSGFVCLVRNPGLMFFLEQGLIPNGLLDFITSALTTGDEKEVSAKVMGGVKELMADGKLGEMLGLARTVCVHALVKPKCHPVPEDEEQRQSDLLYADEIDENDMMFIFNWVTGGTPDLERFHNESASTLQSLRDS